MTTVKTITPSGEVVRIECSITPGIGIHLCGLADITIKETLLRVATALQSIGYTIPGKKVVINITPQLPGGTASSFLDLAVALAIMAESEGRAVPENFLVFGELGLDGAVRRPLGCEACVDRAAAAGRLAKDAVIIGPDSVGNLKEAVRKSLQSR